MPAIHLIEGKHSKHTKNSKNKLTKNNDPFKKWDQDLNRKFSKEEIEIAKETFLKHHSLMEGLQTASDTLEVIIVNLSKPKIKPTYNPAILLLMSA